MTMTAEQRAQLREVAERAASDDWGYDHDEFCESLTPGMILALLDELERKETEIIRLSQKSENDPRIHEIVDLKERIAEREAISSAAEKLVRCKGRYHSEQNYRTLAALFGVTTPDLPPLESEARTVTVKLPPVSFFDFKECSGFANGAYVNLEAMNKALAAAGINLTVEG
uniref:hypothetical protein n=1 Tax=Atlantibacter hermannii TaxID=565 RepID=UPI0035E409FD